MTRTTIKVEYIISSQDEMFNPDNVTSLLNVQPSKVRYFGQKTKYGLEPCDYNSWEIATDYEESLDMYTQINKIRKKIEGKEHIIQDLAKRYSIDNYFMVVVKIRGKETPSIDIEKQFIDYLHKMGASISFDLYVTK